MLLAMQSKERQVCPMFKMPINVKEMLEAMFSFKKEGKETVNVDVVFDVSASDELIEAIYNAFCQAKLVVTSQVKTYILSNGLLELRKDADLCVLVGGKSLAMGSVLAQAKDNGTLTVCVVQAGVTTFEEEKKQSIPYSQNVARSVDADKSTKALNSASNFRTKKQSKDAIVKHTKGIDINDIVVLDFEDQEPLESLARWVALRMPQKRIALALQFPFMRRSLCLEITQSNAITNAAVSLVAFIPGADMPIITANQAKLVLQIAAIYGNKLDIARAKEIIAVVIGAFGFRSLARNFARFIPILGIPIKTAVAYGGTLAVGNAACAYFENDGEKKYDDAINMAVKTGKSVLSAFIKTRK